MHSIIFALDLKVFCEIRLKYFERKIIEITLFTLSSRQSPEMYRPGAIPYSELQHVTTNCRPCTDTTVTLPVHIHLGTCGVLNNSFARHGYINLVVFIKS